jgi:hypothetical protein
MFRADLPMESFAWPRWRKQVVALVQMAKGEHKRVEQGRS